MFLSRLALAGCRAELTVCVWCGGRQSPNRCSMSTSSSTERDLHPYTPPEWVARLKFIPKYKLQLAHPNTPIHKWNLPGVPEGFSVHIKRDDMTGSTLSGNKVRKLEFLLADALDRDCSHVITGGGIQSNHCRATAIACAQLGLKSHLLLRTDIKTIADVGCDGNLLLDRLCGAHLYIVPRFSPDKTELAPRQEKLAESIRRETGEKSYLVPVGGSDRVGLFGYITAFEELISQGVLECFDDLVFACGSGGTGAGLCIANFLTGSKLRIHGVIICDNAKYFHNHIQETLDEVGLGDTKSEDLIDIIEGYKGKGYSISTPEELESIQDVIMKTGIMIDPTYTGKATIGLVRELEMHPQRFQGKRILFLHTGGIYGLFDGRMAPVVEQRDSVGSRVKLWLDKDNDPSS